MRQQSYDTQNLQNVLMVLTAIVLYTFNHWISGSICIVLLLIANWRD